MKLRSIELDVPAAEEAARFFASPWGLAHAGTLNGVRYMRGAGDFPYLVALRPSDRHQVQSITFVCDEAELAAIADRAEAAGAATVATVSDDPGGGEGLLVRMPEGEVLRFLHGAALVEPIDCRDLPVKLTHVVMNATDAEATANFAEAVLGFRVSDRTKGMVFVRCNRSHHSVAFARAGFTSLNHIAFEMSDLDAVMRGIGRMRDAGAIPAWGPGRHGPGANVFAYYIAPFGAVVEFSTATELVGDDHRVGAPEDWVWPEGRIDHWGISIKDIAKLGVAERTFGHAPLQTERNRS